MKILISAFNNFAQTPKWKKSLSHVQLFAAPWTVPTRFLCPWNFQGKNTGMGSHSLFKGIFLIQRSNLSLLHCRGILYQLSYQGSLHSNQKNCFKKIKIEHKVCKKIICKLLKDIPLLFLIFIKIVWKGRMEDLVLNIDLKEVLRFEWKSTKYVKRFSWWETKN